MEQPEPAPQAARVAARVAERYAKVPSYREMLAAEAAKAARAAEAAAEAAREAEKAALAMTDVLWAGVEAGAESGFDMEIPAPAEQREERPAPTPDRTQYRVNPSTLPAAPRNQIPPQNTRPYADRPSGVDPHPHIVDPFEEAVVAPAQPLPARLLEFPRELVAARKARPRMAEGPLRDSPIGADKAQLRIFEVEPDTISREPAAAGLAEEQPALPGWSSIRLDAAPRDVEEQMSAASKAVPRSGKTHGHASGKAQPLSSRAGRPTARREGRRSELAGMLPLHVASLGDRLIAALVDTALVLSAFLLFGVVFLACTTHPPTGRPALIAAAAALAGFITLYQWMFFTFAEGTPGMRFSKLALCTFNDENPDRKTLQRRVGALFLAALPLGLGFLWALLDEDRLGWHDRMTGTYQRSYR